jgi:hypothetical protein
MPERSENVSIEEVRNLATTSIEENLAILNALAEYDKRQEGNLIDQAVDQYFTIKGATGMNVLNYSNSVDVIETSMSFPFKTETVSAN